MVGRRIWLWYVRDGGDAGDGGGREVDEEKMEFMGSHSSVTLVLSTTSHLALVRRKARQRDKTSGVQDAPATATPATPTGTCSCHLRRINESTAVVPLSQSPRLPEASLESHELGDLLGDPYRRPASLVGSPQQLQVPSAGH